MNDTLCCIPCSKKNGLKLIGDGCVSHETSICMYCHQMAVLHLVDELVELRLIMLALKLVPDTSTLWLEKTRKEGSLVCHQRGSFLMHKILRRRSIR